MKTATICIYKHRHGVDVSLYNNLESAFEGAARSIVDPYLHTEVDNPYTRETILGLIRDGKFEDAVNAYNASQHDRSGGESIEFRSDVEILSSQAPAPLAAKCPNCGNDDVEELEITETFRAYHPIRSLTELAAVGKRGTAGVLHVENAITTANPEEHFDDGGGDFRAHCRACNHDGDTRKFGLPDPAEWEWV